MTTTNNGYYTDYEWSLLESLNITDLVANDATTGPTFASTKQSEEKQTAADFLVEGNGEQLYSYHWDRTAARDIEIQVESSGVIKMNSSASEFSVYETLNANNWTANSTGYTKYMVYSAVDASNVDGYFTFGGLSQNKWENLSKVGSMSTQLTYEYGNFFKGGDYGNLIWGGDYDDILIGGQGDDEIHAGGGDTVMYGVGGDNKFYLGTNGFSTSDGQATAFGGDGDDYFNFGDNGGTAIGGGGDNIFVCGDTSNGNSIDIVGGSGTNTFVLGNVPMGSSVTASDASASMEDIILGITIDVAKAAAGKIPYGDAAVSIGESAVSFIQDFLDNSVETITTEAPTQNVIEIWDYNPIKDKLLIPMNASGSDNMKVEWNESAGYIEVTDETGGDTVVAKIHFAHASEIFDYEGGTTAEQPAWFEKYAVGFVDAMFQSAVVIDGERGVAFNGGSSGADYFKFDGMEDLGTNRFMLLGAWHGNVMEGTGTLNSKYYMGTVHDDSLWAYTPDPTDPDYDPASAGDSVFFGFAGNNLFVGGGGDNVYHGGSDTDLVAYYDARESLDIDMSETQSDENGEYFTFLNGFESQSGTKYVDKVYTTVEGIIGSEYNDSIVGNDQDNTFYSTGGQNTWTGTGGANTFFLTGGSATITDYTESDTIMVDKSAYTKAANLAWYEEDHAWVLRDIRDLDEDIATLVKTDDFDAPSEVTMVWQDGSTHTKTVETYYSELLAA